MDLEKDYDGAHGQIKWHVHKSTADLINLATIINPNNDVETYAVCWVKVPTAQKAALETGSDDGSKVWVNRKLVINDHVYRGASPGQDSARIDLIVHRQPRRQS